jgi:hypothetical protein
MAIAPSCLALKEFTEWPELNATQPLLWLVQEILMMSLADNWCALLQFRYISVFTLCK